MIFIPALSLIVHNHGSHFLMLYLKIHKIILVLMVYARKVRIHKYIKRYKFGYVKVQCNKALKMYFHLYRHTVLA